MPIQTYVSFLNFTYLIVHMTFGLAILNEIWILKLFRYGNCQLEKFSFPSAFINTSKNITFEYSLNLFQNAWQVCGKLWFAGKFQLLTIAVENAAEGCSDHWSLKILCTTIKTTWFLWKKKKKGFPFLFWAS